MAYTDLFEQYFSRPQDSAPEANVTPKSTTINYNDDGSHDVTHKMTVAPAVPEQQPAPAPAAQAPESQAPEAPATPVAPPPITPVPAANQILNQPPTAPAVPQAPAQVPPPGQAQMNPAVPTAPVAPPAPGQAEMAQPPAEQLQQPPAAAPQPTIAGQPSSDVGATPTEQAIQQAGSVHAQNLQDWQNDPVKAGLIAGDRRTPEEGGPETGTKIMANKIVGEHYIGEQKKREEQKRVDDMIANNDTVGLANAMKRKKEEEGSYFMAYLYGRLGMHGLQAQEEAKLGAGSTMEQVNMPDGSTALVRVRKDGHISYGHDLETGKELNAKELEGIAGQVTNTKTAQTQAVHAYTTEKSRLEKMRDERISEGYGQADLAKEGLDDASIDSRARKSGNDVMTASRSKYFGAPKEIAMPGAAGQAQTNMNRTEKQGMEVTPAGSKIAAPSWAFDNGMPIISGHRTKDQQAAQIAYYDADGTARTSTGRPVAVPGTSKHETYDAFDVDPAKMTPELERVAREAGFKNDIKGDSNHWYREATPRGQVATTNAEKKGVLENWEQKRPDENFTAYKNRRKLGSQEIEDAAQALADGSMSPKDLSARAGSNLREYAILRAKEINPQFNAANADVMKKTKMDFTSGRTSNQVLAHTTALGQVAMVEDAFKAQQNGDTQALNAIKRRYEIETGSSLPIAAATSVAIFGPEVIKSIVPGGGALHDRLEAKGLLNPNMSPDQFKAAMGIIKNFQGESLLSLRNKWTSSGLPKEGFRNQILSDSPDAQDALDAAEHHRTGRREAATNPPPAPVDHRAGAQAEIDKRRKAKGY